MIKMKYKDRSWEDDMAKLADAFFDHLQLDKRSYSPGGWGLDVKRPFGNSGDISPDIFDIIGIDYNWFERKLCLDDQEELKTYVKYLYEDLGEYLKMKWFEK